MSKLVAVIGAKGGVGKTTIAINLASALCSQGRFAIVADMDLNTPHISLYLGYSQPKTTLHDVIACRNDLRDAIYLHPSGIRVLPGAVQYEATSRVHFSELPRVAASLRDYGEIALLDAPSGLGNDLDRVLEISDAAILVTGDDLVSHSDALKTALRARQMGKPILGVIVNKARGGSDTSAIATFIGEKVLGIVPYDESVLDSHKIFGPVIFTHPQSKASAAIRNAAAALVGGPQ